MNLKNLSKHNLEEFNDLAVLALSTYSDGEIISEEYLEWEYKKNPDGNAIVYIATDENLTVSQYVVLPRKLAYRNEVINASLSVNTITHPAYRGKGLFPKLAESTFSDCVTSEIPVTIGFPNKNSVDGFLGKLKFIEIGNLPLLVKIYNPFRAITNLIYSGNDDPNEELVIGDLRNTTEQNKYSLFDPRKDQALYEVFYEKFKSRGLISTDRSLEYIKWRYIDILFRKYLAIKIVNEGEMIALIVMRIKKVAGIRCGVIVDFIGERSIPELSKIISTIVKRNKLSLVVSTVPESSPEFKSLNRIGFKKVKQTFMFKKLPMILRKHTDNIFPEINDFNRWFVTFGDYDIF